MTHIEKATIKDSVIEGSKIKTTDKEIELSKMENTDNKATDFTALNDVKYPTTQAVDTYIKSKVSSVYRYSGEIADQDIFNKLINGESPYDKVEVGYVYNTSFAATYDGKQYPAGTNFAVQKVKGTEGAEKNILDPLSGLTDLSGKQDKLDATQMGSVNSGITSTKVSGYDTHVANGDIHVTAEKKTAWDGKSTVEAKTAKVTGATELKAVNINGTDWNIPEAGIASVSWGDIGGTLSNQTDLNTALGEKSKVTASDTGVTGATTAKSIKIDETSYNIGVDLETVTDEEILEMWDE